MKRFTETSKWDDPWFIRLPLANKLLWFYICERCDASGVIDFCAELCSVQIGHHFNEGDFSAFGNRVLQLPSGKWQIVKFLPFQYGTVDANCPAHKPVIRQIQANGLKYPINNLSGRVFDTLKEKNKDKEEDKSKSTEGEVQEGKQKRRPQSRDEVLLYVRELGLPETDGHYCFDKWEGNGFKNDGRAILDWKATIRSWQRAQILPSQKRTGPSQFKGRVPEKRTPVDPSKIDLPDKFKSWAIETFEDERDKISKWKTWADVPGPMRQQWWGQTKPPFL